jgi:hypothetical protein
MMSPERQKVAPFFLGGQDILVAYPTDSMDYDAKLQSLKANNVHFARATVFHELLPGHHLQYYYESRSNPHRELFTTPFWVEGWAVWWEFQFWDLGSPSRPRTGWGCSSGGPTGAPGSSSRSTSTWATGPPSSASTTWSTGWAMSAQAPWAR